MEMSTDRAVLQGRNRFQAQINEAEVFELVKCMEELAQTASDFVKSSAWKFRLIVHGPLPSRFIILDLMMPRSRQLMHSSVARIEAVWVLCFLLAQQQDPHLSCFDEGGSRGLEIDQSSYMSEL
jgi:hypothetical protein